MKTTTSAHWNTGEVSEEHNRREEELCVNETHIDLYNEHGDSEHEMWLESDLKAKYEEIFGEALAEYNAKQKRKDRRMTMDEYMQSVADDTRGKRQTKKVNGKKVVDEDARRGKQLSYEMTVKIGNTSRKKDADGRTLYDENGHHIREEELPRELQKTILKAYAETFQQRNPNLVLVNVAYHADEGFYNRRGVWEYSPSHVHMQVLPWADGFKTGLSIQNSMNKAMKAMGFDDNHCYEKFAKREQDVLEEITKAEYAKYCDSHPEYYKEHGDLEVYHPVSDGMREGGKDKEAFIAEQELDEMIHETKWLKKQFENGFHMSQKRLGELDRREKNLDDREHDIKAREDALTYREKAVAEKSDRANTVLTHLNAQISDFDKNSKEIMNELEQALDLANNAAEGNKTREERMLAWMESKTYKNGDTFKDRYLAYERAAESKRQETAKRAVELQQDAAKRKKPVLKVPPEVNLDVSGSDEIQIEL